MNELIGALGGVAGLAGLVAALIGWVKAKTAQTEAATAAAKVRSEDVAAAEIRKRENAEAHKKTTEDLAALRADFAKMNAALQTIAATAEAKDKKIAQLERTVAQQAAALPPAIKPIKSV